jgi:enoyl-CoA hydratase
MSGASPGDEPVIRVEAVDNIRVVTLNRPSVLNCVNRDVHERLTRVWAELAADPGAAAVVVTGAGRAFCSGGDLGYLREHVTDPAVRERSIRYDRIIQTEMIRFPLPVIAAVNGPAVGLGCSLALGCDIVYMAETAYLADPHVSVGLAAGDGGATFWPMHVGLLRAKEYLLTGERIPAQRAGELGLANRVLPDDELGRAALDLARRLAAQPRQALRATKAALNLVLEQVTRGGMEAALTAERESMASPDFDRITDEFVRAAQARAARRAEG